ncbi:MAG: hypothetical protein FD181_2408 [Prolixibacteraceae bacterium]|nr:MAG: hypothetical protein FD181_2408 [Prolixibacteraceae bacterium]
MFQSLFFWKWGFKNYDFEDSGIVVRGFNPCFFGSGVLSGARPAKRANERGFQSLFFWKWGFKRVAYAAIIISQLCFNPCFFGSGVLRRLR